MKPEEVLHFWFEELKPEQWFKKDESVDWIIKKRFYQIWEKAAKDGLPDWENTPQGCLAEIIILDQFSRNIHRDTPRAYEQDTAALDLAAKMIEKKWDQELDVNQRSFVYLPFMHSEVPMMHDMAMILFNVPGLEENYEYEKMHKEIIDRFGRFPHRNAILGRKSTPEELDFLQKHPGF